METQETPSNATNTTPTTPQAHDASEKTPTSEQDQPAENKILLTVEHEKQAHVLTSGQEPHMLLIEATTNITLEHKEKTETGEQKSETLLLKVEKREREIIEGTESVFQEAEHEAKHLLVEVEAHESAQIALLGAKTFGNFWLKFLNDWVLNFASGLAYHLLTAMFPVAIVLLILLGIIFKDPQAQQSLLNHLDALFPNILANQHVLEPTLILIRKDAGWLSILAIILAVFNGSRLFVTLEDYFDVIYHTSARSFWRQNLMAIILLLVFICLIPIMLLASSSGLGGFLGGSVASWLLFETIYIFVPNQHISLRNSWLGALIAAIALQIYVALFPFYARHFLGSYTGNAGFAIILLLFFYYFAVILLIGAEVNAFYAEDIRGTPTNIAGLVHRATLDADKQKLAEMIRKKNELRAMKH